MTRLGDTVRTRRSMALSASELEIEARYKLEFGNKRKLEV